MSLRAGVITFPGSNCDQDMVYVLRNFFEAQVDVLWYRDSIAGAYDLLVLPGGFSYGDYLRSGAIAGFAPAMRGFKEHVQKGGAGLGICNGFQILCESHVLPGALIRNTSLKHICKTAVIEPVHRQGLNQGLEQSVYRIPVSHSDGNYRIDPQGLQELEDQGRILWRYAEPINGSVADIAGICSANGRVLGMMPHPERAVDPLTGGTDGQAILQNVVAMALAG